MPAFKNAQSINIYLNTDDEVNTIEILKESFNQNKKVSILFIFFFCFSNNSMKNCSFLLFLYLL